MFQGVGADPHDPCSGAGVASLLAGFEEEIDPALGKIVVLGKIAQQPLAADMFFQAGKGTVKAFQILQARHEFCDSQMLDDPVMYSWTYTP